MIMSPYLPRIFRIVANATVCGGNILSHRIELFIRRFLPGLSAD
jgi:hypothetical protein